MSSWQALQLESRADSTVPTGSLLWVYAIQSDTGIIGGRIPAQVSQNTRRHRDENFYRSFICNSDEEQHSPWRAIGERCLYIFT